LNSNLKIKKRNKINLRKYLESNVKLKNNVFISNNYSPTININIPTSNIYNAIKKRKDLIEDNEINNNDSKNKLDNKILKEDYNSNIKKKKANFKGKNILKNIGKIKNTSGIANIMKSKIRNGDIIKLSKTDSDLQNMDYEEANIFDKRTYLRMYWGFLVDSQIILGTFFTDNYFDLFVIKLSFLVFTFQISFFLNALFYTDEYISKAYHNDGVLDFFSGLPKSIYSFIATLIITNLLGILSSSKNELMGVEKKNRQSYNYDKIINNKLTKQRIKLSYYSINSLQKLNICLF